MSDVTKRRFRKKKGSEVGVSTKEESLNKSQMEVEDI